MGADIAVWSIDDEGVLEAEDIPARVVTGMDKLVQRVVIELLTPSGSLAANKEFGTDFIPALRRLGITTTANVQQAFGIAERQLAFRLIGENEQDASARYLRSEINDVTLYDNSASITVTVYNSDGGWKQISFSITVE